MNCACKAVKKSNGKTVYKAGYNGTGQILPFMCGFCADKGSPTHVFRTRRERIRHAKRCVR